LSSKGTFSLYEFPTDIVVTTEGSKSNIPSCARQVRVTRIWRESGVNLAPLLRHVAPAMQGAIHWKALEEQFLMVPLVFQFNHCREGMNFF
jgi:hypothetical protein